MLHRLHEPFGKAGFTVALIALVFAMLGGAYAASDNGGSGNATASAKAKKGPRGPKGPKGDTGPAGPVGPAGPAGAKGDKGDSGSSGANGQGAEAISFTGSKGPIGGVTCTAGGVEVKSASGTTLVCNGKAGSAGAPGAPGPPGSPWTVGGTLPSGESLKGNWSFGQNSASTEERFAPVSVSFGLEYPGEPPTMVFVGPFFEPTEKVVANEKENEVSDRCPSTNPEEPSAAPGYICFYEVTNGGTPAEINTEIGFTDATKVGATLTGDNEFEGEFPTSVLVMGTWAVTAP